MVPLAAALAAALMLAGDPASPGAARWSREIGEASRRFAIPAAWIARVMQAESGGRTRINGRPTTSAAGAMGLMQLMPETWDELRRRHRLGLDPHEPRDNILAGTAYLREMYDRFGYPGLFAAYNAGPGTYANHLATGAPLPRETRSYLVRVLGPGPRLPEANRQAGRKREGARWPDGGGGNDAPIFVPLSGAASGKDP